jgi:hypothetical protein
MSKYGLILISLFILFVPQLHPQAKPETQSLAQRAAAEHETVVNGGNDELRDRMQQQLIARAIAERQVQLRQDTEKLLALAAELKQHVDKTGSNILSLDVIKKAQEIEKLAKSVKEKMRDAY